MIFQNRHEEPDSTIFRIAPTLADPDLLHAVLLPPASATECLVFFLRQNSGRISCRYKTQYKNNKCNRQNYQNHKCKTLCNYFSIFIPLYSFSACSTKNLDFAAFIEQLISYICFPELFSTSSNPANFWICFGESKRLIFN